MDKIFAKRDYVFVYIDGILIFSENDQSHMQDIDDVFNIFIKNNLNVSVLNVNLTLSP